MKWASREAVDVYFKAKSLFQLGARTIRAGEPVLIFDSVKTSTLEVAAETSYSTGGRGNNRLLSFEGDKSLTFQFEDALLSNEGLAILAGADLIPARNKHLNGASPNARSVISHYTEKYSITTGNRSDNDPNNIYDKDTSISVGTQIPMGGELNIWFTKKPYVGQNSSIYVMLLDDAGEMSGAPIQINLNNVGFTTKCDNVNDKPEIAKANQKDTTAAAVAAAEAGAAGDLFLAKDKDIIYKTVVTTEADASRTFATEADALAAKSQLTIGQIIYVTANTSCYKVVDNTATTFGDLTDSYAKIAVKTGVGSHHSYLAAFRAGDKFVAFGNDKQPIAKAAVGAYDGHTTFPDLSGMTTDYDSTIAGQFDDAVEYYVFVRPDEDATNKPTWWTTAYEYEVNGVTIGFDQFVRTITATEYGSGTWGQINGYSYLLPPSGGIAQPRCYKEGTSFYYKANVPALLYQDIVLLDYYVEYEHDATQVSILPDKFGPFMYVEGSTLVRRASDGTDLPCEFVIPKFKITTALTFTMQGTGDPSTFTFQGDAYPEYSKFDLTRKVLADIQILDADDNYDSGSVDSGDPTSYRRFKYNNDSDGEYVWKDPSMDAHNNLDYSDIPVVTGNNKLNPDQGGPAAKTSGNGNIDAKDLF